MMNEPRGLQSERVSSIKTNDDFPVCVLYPSDPRAAVIFESLMHIHGVVKIFKVWHPLTGQSAVVLDSSTSRFLHPYFIARDSPLAVHPTRFIVGGSSFIERRHSSFIA